MSARQIMSADQVRRAIVRIGHEIVEKHGGVEELALVGIERRGPFLASRIAEAIGAHSDVRVPVMALDVSRYRDDRAGAFDPDAAAAIQDPAPPPYDPGRTTVILVDDVLFTGRTVRAALDALTQHGRCAAIRLAVLVDRGHRELPIKADHVGKNVPTARHERVELHLAAIDGGEDEVVLIAPERAP